MCPLYKNQSHFRFGQVDNQAGPGIDPPRIPNSEQMKECKDAVELGGCRPSFYSVS